MRIYEHREISEDHAYEVWYVDDICTKRVNPDKPDYLEWIAAGNSPNVVPYVPPEPPIVVAKTLLYSPDKIILALDSMGLLDDFELALTNATPRIRLRWQKASEFVGDDADFIAMVDYLQATWGLTNEERETLLASCEV